MVRKLICFLLLCCMLAAMVAMPPAASAAEAGYQTLAETFLSGFQILSIAGNDSYVVKAYPVSAGSTYRIFGDSISLNAALTLALFSEDLTYGSSGVTATDEIILSYDGTLMDSVDMTYSPVLDGYILIATVTSRGQLYVEDITPSTPYGVYDGNISSTYISIFEDIVIKKAFFSDYLFFRNSQYEYVLLTGEIEYSGGAFSLSSGTEYRIHGAGAYNSSYIYTQAPVKSINVTPGTNLVYSNLGPYPQLLDQGLQLQLAILLLLLIFMLVFYIRSIFSFVLRKRG